MSLPWDDRVDAVTFGWENLNPAESIHYEKKVHNVAPGVTLNPLMIVVRRVEYIQREYAFMIEVDVADRDDGKVRRLWVRQPGPSPYAPQTKESIAHALRQALVFFMTHECAELIKVDGERVFDPEKDHG